MIMVKYIGEADYGCEERPDDAPEMCLVVLEKDGTIMRLELPDAEADRLSLREGTELTQKQILELGL